jgi:hypothetical protein
MVCKVCQRAAPEVEFYDSIATYCKAHWRERVKANRAANAEHYKEFDRKRANLPHRVDARREYIRTDEGKASHLRANNAYRQRNKQAAHNAVSKAIKRGKLFPMPCVVCGADAEAHHPDYNQPLYVIWLCDKHHKEVHAAMKEQEHANAE